MPEKQDWLFWEEERYRFLERDTEGFTKDLDALEAHIKILREVCPKDKAGFPVPRALIHIDRLTNDYNRFMNYLTFYR